MDSNLSLNQLRDQSWKDLTWVAFDTETTGQYPLSSEFCEVAAVKWKNGQVVDQIEALIKPVQVIPDEVIKIHGITNEMVVDAPSITEVVPQLLNFFEDSVLVAHHAAFDVGFLMVEIEKLKLKVPETLIACSSLLSRNVLKKAPNHRLQTLIGYLGIERGAAHRALDDAKACLEVTLHCLEKMGEEASFKEVEEKQGKQFSWQRFSMADLKKNSVKGVIIDAVEKAQRLAISYQGGNHREKVREVVPTGLVRSLDGDYLVGICQIDQKKKRFYLEKITEATLA